MIASCSVHAERRRGARMKARGRLRTRLGFSGLRTRPEWLSNMARVLLEPEVNLATVLLVGTQIIPSRGSEITVAPVVKQSRPRTTRLLLQDTFTMTITSHKFICEFVFCAAFSDVQNRRSILQGLQQTRSRLQRMHSDEPKRLANSSITHVMEGWLGGSMLYRPSRSQSHRPDIHFPSTDTVSWGRAYGWE